MSTPAPDPVVLYVRPSEGAGPCASARCENMAPKYGAAGRPSSPLCNVCAAKLEAARAKNKKA